MTKGGPGSGPHKGEGGGKSENNPQYKAMASHAWDHSEGLEESSSPTMEQHFAAARAHDAAAKAQGSQKNPGRSHPDYDRDSRSHAQMAGFHRVQAMSVSKKHVDIKEAIQNTPAEIVAELLAVTKSAKADGKSYSPQAASVSKAIGRMIAPFSDELSLADLIAIGKAAGLDGAEDTQKSVGKGDPDEDDTDADGADAGRGLAPKKMDFDEDEDEEDEDDEDEQDPEDAEADDDSAEDDEPQEGPEPGAKKVKKSVLMENIALKAKKDDTDEDAEEESDQDAGEDDKVKNKIKPANAKAWGQPKGTKAKGETVAKSTSGSPATEEQYSEIRKSLREQRLENEQLREAVEKTRRDLDEERSFRALETIKKSVRADYGHLNVDVDALAPVLKSLKESSDATMYDQLTATLKAADAQVKAAQDAGGLFRAVGKSSSRSAASGAGATWEDKIEARVDEEFKKSANGRVKAQVYDAFISTDEGREMLSNHRAETAQTRGF